MSSLPAPITAELVWSEIEKNQFAVLGWVTPRGEPRTAGIVYYLADDRRLYIGSEREAWKARQIRDQPSVSLTVTVSKKIPFMPWIEIPPATITFRGSATVREIRDVPQAVVSKLFKDIHLSDEEITRQCFIVVEPHGTFLTYGIGVSLLTMRKPYEAGGRAPVEG